MFWCFGLVKSRFRVEVVNLKGRIEESKWGNWRRMVRDVVVKDPRADIFMPVRYFRLDRSGMRVGGCC